MSQTTVEMTAVENAERLFEAARSFVPTIRDRARAMEKARRLDDDLIEAMDEAKIFSALVPTRFGGLGLGPREVHQLAEILGGADGSTAWVSVFYNLHNCLLCRYPMSVQEELYRDRSSVRCAAVWVPPGKAERVDGGHLITGRWAYATGIHHASHALVPAIVDGSVFWFIVAKDQLKLADDWDMGSMVATGSVTIEAEGAFVADGWGMDIPDLVSARRHHGVVHPEPVYRSSFGAIAGATTSIGIGALDRCVGLCRDKLDTSRPFGLARIDRSTSRVRWVKAMQDARVARYVRDASLAEMLARADSGQPSSLETDARGGLNALTIQHLVKDATRSLLDGFGTSSYHADDQVRRAAGDVAMLATHGLGGDYDIYIDRYSRWALGLGIGPGDPPVRLA